MKKLAVALVVFTSPAFAQTPNPPAERPTESFSGPVKCLPIGKTVKGELVYAMECRSMPVSRVEDPFPPGTLSSDQPASPPASK
jgi:hypothetical protein